MLPSAHRTVCAPHGVEPGTNDLGDGFLPRAATHPCGGDAKRHALPVAELFRAGTGIYRRI